MSLSAVETERPLPVASPRPTRLSLLAPFFAALQFLTVCPPLFRRTFTPVELGRSLIFFPLVGALLGAILMCLDFLGGKLFPAAVLIPLVLTAWVLLTGGLHLDGFLDTCDGLFGGSNPEERLRIMRDERVGAYAVIGGILLILVKYNAIMAVPERGMALLLVPAVGRWAIVPSILLFPYARLQGLGRDMKDNASWIQAFLATVLLIPVTLFAAGLSGLAAVGIVLLWVLLGSWFVLRGLPGLTGDIYGWLCEIAEALVLLTLVAEEQV